MGTELFPETSENIHILTRLHARKKNLIEENDIFKFLSIESVTDTLCRNVGKKTTNHRHAHISGKPIAHTDILYPRWEFGRLSDGWMS